jgi:2-desacetyl-2-hydroxyethyl bacteriochlorophyllide A dehydrogenase
LDLKAYTHMPPGAIIGHEFCGEIVEIGAGVVGQWKEGQAVAAMPLAACGRCRWCLADESAHCGKVDVFGLGGTPGAFAEYVRVSAGSTVSLGEGVGDLGALVEPLAVGLHAVTTAAIRPGDRTLVIGGGNVGAAVALWARRLGAGEVVVSDPSPTRRDGAARFGATDVHDPGNGPAEPRFDIVFECVGVPGMVQTAVDAADVRGRVVVAGVCMEPDQLVPIAAIRKEVEVRFAIFYRGAEFAAAAALLSDGQIDASDFVTRGVDLAGVNSAFETLLGSTNERKILVMPHA